MSTKPNIVFTRFGSPTAADFVEPPSGLRDTGFVGGTPVTAGFVNALFYHGHEWDTWLNDGDCAFHNLSATGTLGVTGASTLADTLAVAGTLTCTVGAVIGGAITIGGNASVGGTLGVTGATTLTGALAANGGATITGTTTALGDVTVATGHAVTLNGTTTLTVGGAVRAAGVYLAAASTDQTIEKLLIPTGTGGGTKQWDLPGQKGTDATLPNVATPYCFALHPGGAYLDYGSANGIFKITPGTLFMKIANADGVNQTFLPFTFDGTQQFPAIAAGSVNYRVDLLQIKIERVSGAVQATLSTKQGTAAASPVIPTCDTGFVPVGFVLVGGSWTNATQPFIGLEQSAGVGQAVLYDLRMPVGVRAIRVDPVLFKLETAWALANQNQVVTSSSATNKMYAPFANAYGPGRIIGFGIENAGLGTAPPTNAGLLRVQAGVAPSTNFLAGHTLSGGTTGASAGSSAITRHFRRDFEDNHVPMGSGPVIQRSATEQVGVPLWANGHRCAQDPQPQASAPFGTAALAWVNTSSGVSVAGAWFAIAAGLG